MPAPTPPTPSTTPSPTTTPSPPTARPRRTRTRAAARLVALGLVLGLVPALTPLLVTAPASAAPLADGPLTVATDCVRGGTVTMRTTPRPRSRVRVVVTARRLAAGSTWTGSVSVVGRDAEQTFRRTATDRRWRVRTTLRVGSARSNEVQLSSSSGRRSCEATVSRTARQVEVEGGCHAAGGYSRLTTSRSDGRLRVRGVWRADGVDRWRVTLRRTYRDGSAAARGRVETALDGSASFGDRGRLAGLRSVRLATAGTEQGTRGRTCDLRVTGGFRR